MSKIPEIKLNNTLAYTGEQNRTGEMCNAYSPIKNLSTAEDHTLGDFTTKSLDFDLLHPVDIILQDSYDGAVNMILNDGKNHPRLINNRFSVVDDNKFKIPEHTGNKNTNIYEEETFDIDTSLKAIAQKIPQIEYKGLTEFGGSLPCGAYTFYFKLADADNNESEILAESGIVQIHIGEPNDINVRMGLEDENSGKSINFKLTNIDSGFDYVHVLYARSSSGNDQSCAETFHKVIFNYPIFNEECNITITGKEPIINISQEELYVDYADIESVKTQEVVNNVLFFGNVKKQEHDWAEIKKASWKITSSVELKQNIGSITKDYSILQDSEDNKGLYYNTYNTYYRVGYWPDEIYRFGIVYIFNDNSLSPVFNIQGVDFNKTEKYLLKNTDVFLKIDSNTYAEWMNAPDDYYFDKSKRLNSKGVIKFPRNLSGFQSFSGGVITPTPLYIKFDLSYIGYKNLNENDKDNLKAEDFFKKHLIKGYFFVRQKRIPTILAQGIAVGLTGKDLGAIPVIKKGNTYYTQSFLSPFLLLSPEGTNISVDNENVTVNALFIPDSELTEATFNLLFVSNKYTLDYISKYYFSNTPENENSIFTTSNIKLSKKLHKRKLTNVPEDIKTTTDGEMYFSTMAGNPSEPYKTSDVKYAWDKTVPLLLTISTSVIRGLWGCFVGVGDNLDKDTDLTYGGVYNIKKENYYDDEESAIDLDFQLRMSTEDSYHAICDRTEIKDEQKECYRGDCFQSLYTHRILRNFIDPELPTNNKIINPACWGQNYLVRCTAIPEVLLHSNLTADNAGWYIPEYEYDKSTTFANEVTTAFEVCESDEYYKDILWDPDAQEWYREGSSTTQVQTTTSSDEPPVSDEQKESSKRNSAKSNEQGKEGREYLGTNLGGLTLLSKYLTNAWPPFNVINPSELKTGSGGGIISALFKSNRWAVRGINNINRADVNAVGLGQWITFPICSAKNLALRDVDYSNATEQASFNKKRSFYPLTKMDMHNPLRDSNVINAAAGISIPHKKYYLLPEVPFIKQEYFTRIINSLRDSAESITNEFKVMLETAFRDYTKVYGPITKLVALGSKMLVVFHHGLGVLAINDAMSSADSPNKYLPVELSMVLSSDYGSMWKDSVISTPKGIYGIDTVAKVIWKVSFGDIPQLELISNFKIEKFLIDNIDLSEFVNTPFIGRINVKSHYNAFKQDVIFTYYNDILYLFDSNTLTLSDFDISSDGYLLNKGTKDLYLSDPDDPNSFVKGEKVKAYYDEENGKLITYSDIINESISDDNNTYDIRFKWATGKSWAICYNEILNKFITFYDWIPLESENIDNIYFSFDREAVNELTELTSGNYLSKYILPANGQEYGGIDYKYGTNAIDPTFNSSAPVIYFDDAGEITFEVDYQRIDGKVLVCGFYLLGGANYKVSTPYRHRDIPLQDKNEEWTFVTVKEYNTILNSEKLTITINIIRDNSTEGIIYNNFAVSAIITNNIENKAWISNIGDEKTAIEIPDKSELPEYYSVRTLTDSLPLWKHGFAGLYDNADELKPTFWYGKQHEFNFEFVARQDAMHKIFNNLCMISNKAEPHKFEFEVVGEAYEWRKYKSVLKKIADSVTIATDNPKYTEELEKAFKEELDKKVYPKLPYITVTDACVPTLDPQIIGDKKEVDKNHSDNTVACCLVYDKQLNEFRVHTEQLGNDVRKYGRLKGNMEYLEDLWRIEIRPVSFKWVYLNDKKELEFTRIIETRHRDKYIKIKVRYTGEDLAIIQAIQTFFDYSYA